MLGARERPLARPHTSAGRLASRHLDTTKIETGAEMLQSLTRVYLGKSGSREDDDARTEHGSRGIFQFIYGISWTRTAAIRSIVTRSLHPALERAHSASTQRRHHHDCCRNVIVQHSTIAVCSSARPWWRQCSTVGAGVRVCTTHSQSDAPVGRRARKPLCRPRALCGCLKRASEMEKPERTSSRTGYNPEREERHLPASLAGALLLRHLISERH